MSFRKGTWTYLSVLIAELSLIFLVSFMDDFMIFYVLFTVALFWVFGSVIATLWHSFIPRLLAFTAGLVALASGFVWAIPGVSAETITIAFTVCTFSYAAFALISIVAMIRNVFEIAKVTADKIVGSICVYLLLGMFFTFVYAGLDLLSPNTFNFAGADLISLQHFRDYLYFSFVTITTLGYGDVVPLLPASRLVAMLEAIIGQVYLVVMVAMLVGIHVSGIASRRRLEGGDRG